MPLLAIPNASEGRDQERIAKLVGAVRDSGARVLDLHQDEAHHRSVITATGTAASLVEAMAHLAAAASYIDLARHEGVHPRLGGLDVCPLVPVNLSMAEAVEAAHQAGRAINRATGVPIYFYGEAAEREEARELPSIRSGGLSELKRRAQEGFTPDIGSADLDISRGVICVGARGTLIAFNVWLRCSLETARWIAGKLRASSGGLPGIRALGLMIHPPDVCQVSMNLTEPDATGIQEAFGAVESLGRQRNAQVMQTELVGLVPRRYLPPPDATATRLLKRPGRSLEDALRR